jgi:hypothetical protein
VFFFLPIQHWDEDVHGSMDTNANRCRFPEGFAWSCCGESGATLIDCCKLHGSTFEELYPIEISDDDTSQNEGGSNDDEDDEGDDEPKDDEEAEMHHNGDLVVVDLQSNLWEVKSFDI